MACKELPSGQLCLDTETNSVCGPFQLTKLEDKALCYIDNIVNEHLNIGGADVNVFKLLGVHEQGSLVDLAKNGVAISSGDGPGFPAGNVFTTLVNEWRSTDKGQDVLDKSYIGYDFGEIKLPNGRDQYAIETFVRHNIATIQIKQSSQSKNRVIRARIERSDDGVKWFGAAIIELPDIQDLTKIHFKHTVPSRFWRIRPLEFNGGVSDYWGVQALELIDYDLTSIDDIQDPIFQENRDRDYATQSIELKTQYDLLDIQTELTKFGIELPSQTFYMQFGFTSMVQELGRPLAIGDILELPSETQYAFDLTPIKKYLEVTDVGWSIEGFTPGWTPTLMRIIAQPMLASQETQDLFEGLERDEDDTGLSRYGLVDLEGISGEHSIFQDNSNESETVAAEANTQDPERGKDTNDIQHFTDQQIQNAADQGLPTLSRLNANPTGLYIEDAMPPNGVDFTEGDELPNDPVDGDYHRLTYTNIDTDIPPRLFRFSLKKNRWIFLESDKRKQWDKTKPRLLEFYKTKNNPTSNKDIK